MQPNGRANGGSALVFMKRSLAGLNQVARLGMDYVNQLQQIRCSCSERTGGRTRSLRSSGVMITCLSMEVLQPQQTLSNALVSVIAPVQEQQFLRKQHGFR